MLFPDFIFLSDVFFNQKSKFQKLQSYLKITNPFFKNCQGSINIFCYETNTCTCASFGIYLEHFVLKNGGEEA